MVKWVKIGDLLEYEQPTKYLVDSTEYDDRHRTPVLTAGQSFILGYTNETAGIYKASSQNPTIIFDDFTTNFHFVSFDFKVKSSAMKMLRPKKDDVSFKYVYYSMLGIKYTPAEHARQWISCYSNFEIPLPSLSEQQRIVDILDKFEGMVENVEKELLLRQKQYEVYREKIIAEVSSIGIVKTLGEIGTFIRGNGLQKSDFVDKGRPCIHYGQIHTYYGLYTNETISCCKNELWKKLKHARKGDLLIATTSEDVEACCKATAWMGEEEVAYSGDSFCFSHNQNPIYVAHLFKTESFAEQKKPAATGAKVVRVSGDAMSKFKFPFPSPDKQQEIVAKLDKFEEMISTLKKELELRKKQYEYYREKLLTFE